MGVLGQFSFGAVGKGHPLLYGNPPARFDPKSPLFRSMLCAVLPSFLGCQRINLEAKR